MASQSMITIIRNNRKLLPNRDKFKTRLGGYNSKKKTEYNLPKASEKQLREIRKRIQNENKIYWIKVVALTLIGVLILMSIFFF